MGCADLSNISNFFVSQLYLNGTLSIDQCARALHAKGETLHCSSGSGEDDSILRFGLMAVVASLWDPPRYRYHEYAGHIIEPVLTVWSGKKAAVSKEARRLLKVCEENPQDVDVHTAAAARLEGEGQQKWAQHVRALLRQREAFQEWESSQTDGWAEAGSQGFEVFDSIHWRFAPGWRRRYREVPRLGLVDSDLSPLG